MKNNRKGFTIVELVIVIAVIAILAAVLIPTFSSVIDKANKSQAMQACRNAYVEAYAEAIKDGGKVPAEGKTIYVAKKGGIATAAGDDNWSFTFNADGEVTAVVSPKDYNKYSFTVTDGEVAVNDAATTAATTTAA